ncbi:VIT domain-containing protein [Flavobacterium sp.]|uniref:VIT domain-containing protein n=1 Tax=Flavobacterium sp. TaxID=239 RepID=UPI003D6AF32B
MKNVRLVILFLLSHFAYAQSPQLNVKGADSVRVKMSQLLVSVKVVGNIAYTTAEMHFTNSGTQQMEGELLFPLPEGVSVSRYAIDINGKIREAVPVNKNKGQQVFEAIEHRRVDPGLLEKVAGNNFRTRIYPILPNQERIVIIGYEQELSGFDKSNLMYQLVSRFPQKLEKFEVEITVLGAASKPIINNETNEVSLFEKFETTAWNNSFYTSIKKTNYQPSEKVAIKIPIQQEIPGVVVQSINEQYYFYANMIIEKNKIHKRNPNSIGLIWDNSLSCKNRDLKKELQLLEDYFKEIKNTQVTLYFLNYTFEKDRTFTITNGNWSELRTLLETTLYDGGSRFSKIKLSNHDECLFFTDGLSSLSDNQIEKVNKPVYTITSVPSSDFAFLNYTALKTGGSFINLNRLDAANALDQLLFQNLKFLGVKDNYTVTELYPMLGTPVSGNFSISGISLKNQNEVVLLFGYGDHAVLEKKLVIDAKNQKANDVNIEKLWAQKKIANLEVQYQKNAEEIEILGKKYGIITPNTSLIVLEDIHDYIQYDIVPPAELRTEFDRIMKEQRASALAKTHSNWENIEDYRKTLEQWWNKNTKYVKPKEIKKPKRIKNRTVAEQHHRQEDRPVEIREDNPREQTSTVATVRGEIRDASGPLPGVNVMVKGTTRGTQTNFDGTYSISANRGDVIQTSFLGMNDKEFTVRGSGVYNVFMVENNAQLSEVVVQAYGTSRGREDIDEEESDRKMESVSYSTQSVKTEEISGNRNLVQPMAARVEGLAIRGVASIANGNVTDTISNSQWSSGFIATGGTKVNSWSPDRVYLKALDAAPLDRKYSLYLQLREENLRNPNFYFDVANYFYNAGDKPKGILILSNIADLGLENHQLYKSLTYQLRQWEAYEDALFTAKQVAKWREQEPQSHRDLALTLEDNKEYQAAFDELIKALETNYFGEMSGQYEGVEDIILMDINRMIAEHSSIKTGKLDAKYVKKMPVAVRIILNWNQMDTDIDLHIIEPTGEECFYGHRDTQAGARFSKDFTQGYGPEQYLLRNAVKGTFIVKTNYYGESALTENGPTTVMVEIYTTRSNGTVERKLQTIQLGTIKERQNLAEIVID